MPIIKSAIKRVRQSETRRKRNLITKNKYKTLVKEFNILIEGKKGADAAKLFPQVQKAIDMAVKKNLLHANNAARMKSNLSKALPKAAPKAAAKPAATKEAKSA